LFASRIEGSGNRTLRRSNVSTRKFSARKRRRTKTRRKRRRRRRNRRR